MKSLFTFFLIATVFSVSAQDGVIVKFFDSAWKPTSKENAVYYTHFIKEDTLYKCTSYYAKSNKLYGKSTFADTLFSNGKGRGLMLRYFESGLLKDSTLFDNNGIVKYMYEYYQNGIVSTIKIYPSDCDKIDVKRYYESGVLWVHQYYDTTQKKIVTLGYDEAGKIDTNFIYQKPAEFPGGSSEWKKFLERNINNNLPKSNGAPLGVYKIIVDFLINKEGNISDVSAENDPGYGTKEEAIRVINKSPNWLPAVQYNKYVNFRNRQPITFVVDSQVVAEFPGGTNAWSKYLQRHLKASLPEKNGAPKGNYSVTVDFVIESDGTISDVTAENNPGFGASEEAMRVVSEGPKWKPARINGYPVKSRSIQKITFVVN